MKSLLRTLFLLGLLGTAVHESPGQAIPTASRPSTLQFGAGWGITKPGYVNTTTQGLTIYGSYDFTRHWGIAGDIHRNSTITPINLGYDTYMLGPRYVFHFGRLNPYIKFQGGLGRVKYKYPNQTDSYTYKLFAAGVGLDYRLTPRINVRAINVERQRWPGVPQQGISPYVFSFGAAYLFH